MVEVVGLGGNEESGLGGNGAVVEAELRRGIAREGEGFGTALGAERRERGVFIEGRATAGSHMSVSAGRVRGDRATGAEAFRACAQL